MVAPRYRPPSAVPDPASPIFRGWLLQQFRELAEDSLAIAANDPPTVISQERLDVPAGAQRRVSPPEGGMVCVLEAPSPANSGRAISLIIEGPVGTLTVVAAPHVAVDGKVTASTINDDSRASFTLAGVVTFTSNGQNSWKTQAEVPSETAATGAAAEAFDATYLLQTASSALPSGRVAASSSAIEPSFAVPGFVSWGFAAIASQRALGNDAASDAAPTEVSIHQELDWIGGEAGLWIFDGTDDLVAIGNVLPFERTDSFTLSFWGDATIDGSTDTGINKTTTTSDQRGYRITINSSNQLQFSVINNAAAGANSLLVASTATITPGLHHFAAVYTGTSTPAGVTLYVDGAAVAMSTLSNTLSATIANTASLTIGARSDAVNPWRGLLRHASVWNDDLSAAEILEIYNGGSPPDLLSVSAASDLVGWWRFDGSDATGAGGIIDASSNSNNGTAAGGLAPVTAQGAIPARGAAVWQLIAPGTSGLPLCSNGLSAVPSYQRLTNAAVATAAANTVRGNNTASTADVTDIAVGTNTVLGRVAGNIVAAQLATGQAADAFCTNAKLANMVQATIKLRASGAGTGVPIDGTVTQALDMAGSTRGSLLERGASAWGIITPGTSGLALVSAGAGADPAYAALGASGLSDAIISPAKLAVVASNIGATFLIRQTLTAGTPGSADDVTIYNADAPFAFRIVDVTVIISTAIALSTVQLRDTSGGGGAALSSTFASAVAGEAAISVSWTATTTVAANGSVFVRRSDQGVAGEVLILCVRT